MSRPYFIPPEGMLGATKNDLARLAKLTASNMTPYSTALPMELPGGGRPNARFPYAFRKGDSSWAVYALQVALNSHQQTYPIAADGIFGPVTEECVKREQRNHHLRAVDGICGPATQRAIARTEAINAEEYTHCPGGLLYGIAEGESGFFFACVAGPNWNNSYDAGIIQDNLTGPELDEQAAWKRAFNLRWGFRDTGTKLRRQKDEYKGKPGAATDQWAWFCAILYHNWPAAAERWANNQFASWRYYAIDSNGVGRFYTVDEPAYWVIQASAGRLQTARQWALEYVRTKSHYVTNWTV